MPLAGSSDGQPTDTYGQRAAGRRLLALAALRYLQSVIGETAGLGGSEGGMNLVADNVVAWVLSGAAMLVSLVVLIALWCRRDL